MSGEDEGIRRQRATWSAGDFTVIAGNTVLPGELLCESVGLRAGQKVLDVATGTGNTALSAARRLCVVTGVDLVPSLLDVARKRAEVERLTIEFKEGVAEDIHVLTGPSMRCSRRSDACLQPTSNEPPTSCSGSASRAER